MSKILNAKHLTVMGFASDKKGAPVSKTKDTKKSVKVKNDESNRKNDETHKDKK